MGYDLVVVLFRHDRFEGYLFSPLTLDKYLLESKKTILIRIARSRLKTASLSLEETRPARMSTVGSVHRRKWSNRTFNTAVSYLLKNEELIY